MGCRRSCTHTKNTFWVYARACTIMPPCIAVAHVCTKERVLASICACVRLYVCLCVYVRGYVCVCVCVCVCELYVMCVVLKSLISIIVLISGFKVGVMGPLSLLRASTCTHMHTQLNRCQTHTQTRTHTKTHETNWVFVCERACYHLMCTSSCVYEYATLQCMCMCVCMWENAVYAHMYISAWYMLPYRVAKSHRMPYGHRSCSAKEPYSSWLFYEKRSATEGILWVFATLYSHARPWLQAFHCSPSADLAFSLSCSHTKSNNARSILAFLLSRVLSLTPVRSLSIVSSLSPSRARSRACSRAFSPSLDFISCIVLFFSHVHPSRATNDNPLTLSHPPGSIHFTRTHALEPFHAYAHSKHGQGSAQARIRPSRWAGC